MTKALGKFTVYFLSKPQLLPACYLQRRQMVIILFCSSAGMDCVCECRDSYYMACPACFRSRINWQVNIAAAVASVQHGNHTLPFKSQKTSLPGLKAILLLPSQTLDKDSRLESFSLWRTGLLYLYEIFYCSNLPWLTCLLNTYPTIFLWHKSDGLYRKEGKLKKPWAKETGQLFTMVTHSWPMSIHARQTQIGCSISPSYMDPTKSVMHLKTVSLKSTQLTSSSCSHLLHIFVRFLSCQAL